MKTHVEELIVLTPAEANETELLGLVWQATVDQILSVPGMVLRVLRKPKRDTLIDATARILELSPGLELYGQTYVAYKTRVLVNDELWEANAQS